MKDRVAAFVAQGFKPARIAEIVGCTPARVSQIEAEADFPALVEKEKQKLEKIKQEEKLEEEYVRLEEATLAQVKDSLPFAEFGDLTRLMDSLIRRKQQRAPFGLVQNNQHNEVTVLNIPVSVLPGEIILNKQREMIAVGDKTLAPMTSKGVKSLFEALGKKRLPNFPEIDVTKLTNMPDDF